MLSPSPLRRAQSQPPVDGQFSQGLLPLLEIVVVERVRAGLREHPG